MLTNETQQNVANGSAVTFAANTLTPAVGSSFTVSGNNGLELATGQYLVTFVSDAGVTGAGTIGAELELDGTPVTAAETSLARTDATVERIALNAIVNSTGGQTLTVANNSGDENTHENSVLTVVKLS